MTALYIKGPDSADECCDCDERPDPCDDCGCAPCHVCDSTPCTIRLTLSGYTLCCLGPFVFDYYYSLPDLDTELPATIDVPFSSSTGPGGWCTWYYEAPAPSITWKSYYGAACTGTPYETGQLTLAVRIRLNLTANRWTVEMLAGSIDEAWFGIFFEGTSPSDVTDCFADVPSIANDRVDCSLGGASSPVYGGTVSLEML